MFAEAGALAAAVDAAVAGVDRDDRAGVRRRGGGCGGRGGFARGFFRGLIFR